MPPEIANAENDYAVVYASGLTIQDRSLLASMALFYDRILLPHPYDLDPECRPLMRWSKIEHLDSLDQVRNNYTGWKQSVKDLLDEGVLGILPEAPVDPAQVDLGTALRDRLRIKVPHFASSHAFDGRIALAMHALFGSSPAPDFIETSSTETGTTHLRNVLATSLFQFAVPRIGALGPQELLRLREKTRAERNGLRAHLDSLLKDVRVHLADTRNDREAALRTIREDIIPPWVEFKAQRLPSLLSGIFTGVQHTVEAVRIFLAPWNLASYPAIIRVVADASKDLAEAAKERAANDRRTYQLLSRVEKASQKASAAAVGRN